MAEDASILREMTLADVVLPGTHDAGAYALTSKLMPGARFPTPWEAAAIAIAEDLGINVDRVITPWALTQSLDVLAQLEFGYRYVDVRAGWNGTGWYAHHAEVGVPVTDILHDVHTFMQEHPGEVVVMQVSHLDGFPDATQVTLNVSPHCDPKLVLSSGTEPNHQQGQRNQQKYLATIYK